MLPVIVVISCLVHIASAQTLNPDNGQLYYNLPFIVVPIVVFILTILGIICGAYLIYRARYGAFGCCGPRMRYKVQYSSDEESRPEDDLPPYKASPGSSAAPPNYEDALQISLLLKDKMIEQDCNTSDTTHLNP